MFRFRVNGNASFSLNRANVFPFQLLLVVMSDLFPTQPLYHLSSQNVNLSNGCLLSTALIVFPPAALRLGKQKREQCLGFLNFNSFTSLMNSNSAEQNRTTYRPCVNICKADEMRDETWQPDPTIIYRMEIGWEHLVDLSETSLIILASTYSSDF